MCMFHTYFSGSQALRVKSCVMILYALDNFWIVWVDLKKESDKLKSIICLCKKRGNMNVIRALCSILTMERKEWHVH